MTRTVILGTMSSSLMASTHNTRLLQMHYIFFRIYFEQTKTSLSASFPFYMGCWSTLYAIQKLYFNVTETDEKLECCSEWILMGDRCALLELLLFVIELYV